MTQTQESPAVNQRNVHPLESSAELLAKEQLDNRVEDDLANPGSLDKKDKDFAAMNGVSIQLESLADREAPEPEEITTTRTIPQNPLLKMAVIGGIILVFIMIVGGLINGSMNALNFSATKIESPKINLETIEEPVKDETGQNKTALALTSQNVEFKKIRDQKAEATSTSASTPSPTFTPVPVAPPPPATRTIPQRTQPVTVSRNPSPPRINTPTRRSLPVSQPQAQPQPKQVARVIPNASSAVKIQPLDPMQQWLAVANVGSFSANSSTETSSNESISSEEVLGGSGTPKSVRNAATNVRKETSINQPENIDYNAKRILVGTRTEGKIENPIAISGKNTNLIPKYLIRLTSSLKAFDGSEVLPVGSYLVVVPNGSNGSEYIQLTAISALININGETLEKNIPENSILILNKNGESLRGESHKGSSLGSNLMTAVIAGVSKAAEIENNPSSQTTISNNGYSTSTSSNDSKNLLAGFAQGSFSQILQSIQSSNQQQIQSLQSESRVFIVPANTTVQIFVNETISL